MSLPITYLEYKCARALYVFSNFGILVPQKLYSQPRGVVLSVAFACTLSQKRNSCDSQNCVRKLTGVVVEQRCIYEPPLN